MFNMIPTLMAVLIALMFMPLAQRWVNQSHDAVQAHDAATQAIQIEQAADSYIRNNYQAIVTATAGAPQQVSIATLQANGYLPAAVSSTNAYGQTWSLSLYQPSAGNIEALLTTSGGIGIPRIILPGVAAQIGSKGGFQPYSTGVYAASAGDAVGSYGGWKVPVSAFGLTPQPGRLALFMYYRQGQQSSDYLYRVSVPGQPQLNAMQTDLSLQSQSGTKNNITGVNDVSTNTVTASGNVGSAGKSPTAGYPAGWSGGVHTNDVYAEGNIGAGTGGTANAYMTSAGYGYFKPGNATLGSSCTPNGLIGADSSGSLLSCANGTWQIPLQYRLPHYVSQAGWLASDGNYVPKPTCQSGGVPRVIVTPLQIQMPNSQYGIAFSDFAYDAGSSWQIRVISFNPGWNYGGRAIVRTFCYYP